MLSFGLPARLAASAGTIAAEAAAAPATAEATFRFWSGLIHRQASAAHLVLIELGGGLLRFLIGRHLDEGESPGAAGRCVAHDAHRLDVPRLAEELLQLRLTGRVWKIPYVKPSTHHALPFSHPAAISTSRRGNTARSPGYCPGPVVARQLSSGVEGRTSQD